jgi:hypothetical protein
MACYRQKCTASLRIFGENATFHSAYFLKTRYSAASSLNTLYTAKSVQSYSSFLPIMFSLTTRFCQKCEV